MVEKTENRVMVKDLTANPAPLGLLGFGLTTVLLNIHNAGFYPLNSMILAMGIAYGGIAQILACWMEYKKGNTFGMVAFGSYGLFWWSFVLLLILPKMGLATPPDPVSLIHVGTFHICDVLCFFETQQRTSSSFHIPDSFILPLECGRIDWKHYTNFNSRL